MKEKEPLGQNVSHINSSKGIRDDSKKNRIKYDFTVMLIDNNDADIETYADALDGLCSVNCFSSAFTALESIMSGTLPDLIIMDCYSSDPQAMHLCQSLKQKKMTANVPVIILTNHTEVESKLSAFQHGCVDYLTKPIHPLEFYHRVDVCLKLIRSRRDLEMMSFIDPVTGVSNRRTFDFMLQKEWNRCVRYSSGVSLVLIELSDFSRFVAQVDNALGDECLKRIAKMLSRFGMRSNDLFARFGGYQFVLLLPGCEVEGAKAIAEKMLGAIVTLNVSDIMAQSYFEQAVSLSIGVAVDHPQAGSDKSTLFELADDAKFLANKQGPNRYSVANSEPTQADDSRYNRASTSGIGARGYIQRRSGMRAGDR